MREVLRNTFCFLALICCGCPGPSPGTAPTPSAGKTESRIKVESFRVSDYFGYVAIVTDTKTGQEWLMVGHNTRAYPITPSDKQKLQIEVEPQK